MNLMKWCICLLPFAALAARGDVARAQDGIVAAPATPSATTDTVTRRGGPSRIMLSSGLLTFGLTYGAGAVVAATSDRQADHRMFVPIAGPWMSLTDRGECGGAAARSCDGETSNKALIVADGIGQGLGAFLIVDSFLHPERITARRTRVARARPALRLSPASVGAGGYGVVASGTF